MATVFPDGTIDITFEGSAGNSSGHSCRGITLQVYGDANDYVGKGVGRPVRCGRPTTRRKAMAEENIIGGNVILFGATSGQAFIRGTVGERFAVHNSGAHAVVEGGDHGCEHMTGGRVVILGPTGRNFAAGCPAASPTSTTRSAGCRRTSTPRWWTSKNSTTPMSRWLHEMLVAHRDATGFGCGRTHSGRVATTGRGISPEGDAARLQECAGSHRQRRTNRRGRGRGDHGGLPWLIRAASWHTHRETPVRRPVPLSLRDWKEVYEEFEHENLQHQASRCMDCGILFCHNGCPLGNLIPEWNDLVYRDRWRDAIERLHATNNFPEFTGRLCPLREASCVLGINSIRSPSSRWRSRSSTTPGTRGLVEPNRPHLVTGKSVAVVGSGPAGLAAAQQLTRAGHDVTVFERADRIGGLLRYGIPEFKMEKRHIDRRLEQMEAEGTNFRAG